MELKAIKMKPTWKVSYMKNMGIQAYDTRNDYPQKVELIANGSSTISNCIDIFHRFLVGKGLPGEMSNFFVGNEKLGDILEAITLDYAKWYGFAIHVRYNSFGDVAGLSHIPFEYCRLGIPDENGNVKKVAINKDWLGEFKSPSSSNTIYCDVYDPSSALSQIAEAGGIDKYNGQVLYATKRGDNIYPNCIFESVLTDGAAQIACANIRLRNSKNGFMPFGAMVVRKTKDTKKNNGNGAPKTSVTEELVKLQGDVNTSKMFIVELEPNDQEPKFLKLDGERYDGAFQVTEETTKANIGERFMQPPILRCEQTASGFAEDVMKQAYDYYNSITLVDRRLFERKITELLSHWYNSVDLSNVKIIPLQYGSASTAEGKEVL